MSPFEDSPLPLISSSPAEFGIAITPPLVRTFLSSMMMQAIGHPTDVHGIISEYRVEAVTLSFSEKNFERDIIKYGKIIEGYSTLSLLCGFFSVNSLSVDVIDTCVFLLQGRFARPTISLRRCIRVSIITSSSTPHHISPSGITWAPWVQSLASLTSLTCHFSHFSLLFSSLFLLLPDVSVCRCHRSPLSHSHGHRSL